MRAQCYGASSSRRFRELAAAVWPNGDRRDMAETARSQGLTGGLTERSSATFPVTRGHDA